jgi:hypothetical protein
METKPGENEVDGRPSRPATEPAQDTAGTGDADPGPKEIGGRKGPDPTRYGDWEKNGRCIDF